MKQGQETNQIRTQEAGTHDTHDRGLTLLPPPERLVPSLNSSIREGGWALWRPLWTNTDNALQGQTDRTGQPTGTRSPPGLAWRLRLPPGMTSQGPIQGPSASASTSMTRGQAARMASMATTRGVSVDKTDMNI